MPRIFHVVKGYEADPVVVNVRSADMKSGWPESADVVRKVSLEQTIDPTYD